MLKILIVDDEYIERKGLIMLCRRYFSEDTEKYGQIELLEAENGRVALEIALRERPNIVLTDIRMPLMDGIALAEGLHNALPETVTVIISAYGEFEYARQAIEYKVSHYILKPINPADFRIVMGELLERMMEKKLKGKEDQKLKKELTSYNLSARGKSMDRVVNEILSILHNEYMEQISVESIAERVYLSPSYLSYLFKKYTNRTIIKYLTELRLEKAAEILKQGNMKIVDVAQSVGYNDTAYFCSIFKNKYELTPSEYRSTDSLEE